MKIKIPARLISAWCNKERPCGSHNISIKYSILNNVSKIIPSIDSDSNLESWTHLAQDKLTWSMLVNNLGCDQNFDYDNWNNNFKITPANHLPQIIIPLQIIHPLILNLLFHLPLPQILTRLLLS